MKDVKTAVDTGKAVLKRRLAGLTGSFSYEETAYHLPVTFALTGSPVHTAEEARMAFPASGENSLVAAEDGSWAVLLLRQKSPVPGYYHGSSGPPGKRWPVNKGQSCAQL